MNNQLLQTLQARVIKHNVLLITAAAFLLLGITVGHLSKACAHLKNDDHHDPLSHDESENDPCAESDACETACATDELGSLETVTCEHDISIIDCDHCRFEVGVVKIAPPVAESLIQTGVVEHIVQTNVLTLTGQVQLDPTRSVDIVPPGGGQVSQIKKLLGEKVTKGDVLAILHSADLGESKADFLDVQARLEMASLTFEREEELYEKKIASKADYLEALNDLKSAEAAYSAAEKKLRLFGLDTEHIERIKDENGTFADLILRAPLDGMIIAQNISVGKMVETNEHLYTVADLSNLWVWCDVYEKDLAVLHEPFERKRSLDAVVTVKAFEDAGFEGTVDLVGNLMDERTRTVKIRVQTKNLEGKLRPGMFAEIDVMLPAEGDMTVVPSNAVMADEGNHFVFRHLKDDLWIRQDVVMGKRQGGLVEVLEGVSKADRIITGGAFMLKSEVLKEKMGAGCAH
jgi:cobalt-zinc-cadmium efflux system membrane fusion protein